MKVNAIICPSCGDTVYSRARHDMRSCSCGEVAIDGGFDYVKISFKNNLPLQVDLEIGKVDKIALYDDWNSGRDTFGLIKKVVDSNPNFTQTKLNMKTLIFNTAVLEAVALVRSQQSAGFSIHDITKKLRAQVNSNEVEFSDRATEDVDGVTTYRVRHDDVKYIFEENLRNGTITGLDISRSPAGFRVFSERNQQAAPAVTSAHNATSQVSNPLTNPNVVPVVNTAAIADYLKNQKSEGYVSVPLKAVQSRFKGVKLTCAQYVTIIEGMGYAIDKVLGRDDCPSTWSVLV